MEVAFWRRWHRWIGFPAALFLLFAATTGILVAFTEFFGAEEALREATRDVASPIMTNAPSEQWVPAIERALRTVTKTAGALPIDKIELQPKGDHPTVSVFSGKPTGGEDRKFVVDARSGALLSVEAYADKPFLTRLHSVSTSALRMRRSSPGSRATAAVICPTLALGMTSARRASSAT